MKNKTLISLAVASILPLATSTAHATLANDALLNFDPGVITCVLGVGTPPDSCSYGTAVNTGSYFGMDTNGNGSVAASERTALTPYEGLFLGITQIASGSHGGAPGCDPTVPSTTCNDTVPTSESPGIDAAWGFFGNTGLDFSNTATNLLTTLTANTATIDFSGWTVTWNGIASIPMSGGAWQTSPYTNASGEAVVNCAVDCGVGDTYTLDYSATVPPGDPSGFGGVKYNLHLVGTIGACTGDVSAPTTASDSYNVATNTNGTFVILANDSDSGCSGLNKGSVALTGNAGPGTTVTTTAGGTATVDTSNGVVTYNPPNSTYQGPDSFTYTVADRAVNPSSSTNVNILIGDVPPTCVGDGISDGALITSPPSPVTVDVLANDITRSNPIDVTKVKIIDGPANGIAVANLDGTITYTPNAGFIGTDPFTYTVDDMGGSSVLTCTKATVDMTVVNTGQPIAGVANADLSITAGKVTDINTKPAPGDGSWFSMETAPGTFTYTSIAGLDGVILNTTQDATTAGGIIAGIDQAWTFFGNQGVDRTTSDLAQLSNDGSGNATLDFSGWNVSWNGIPSIPIGTGATVAGYADSTAVVKCAVDCTDGDTYTLNYSATVPPGDASGFGGVHYFLHLEGAISSTPPLYGCLDSAAASNVVASAVIDDCVSSSTLVLAPGDTATAVGNTTGIGLTAAQIGKTDPLFNPKDGQMCVGGCIDFKVENIATDHVDVVVKLNAPIPAGGVYRKLANGKWKDFDLSANDKIGSAPLDSTTGNCPQPTGSYKVGLRTGNQCLFLKIYDGGPNDADGAVNGTIVDPGGVLVAGSPNVPSSGTSGCSISSTPVKLSDRSDWIVVMLFIAVLGISRRKLKKN